MTVVTGAERALLADSEGWSHMGDWGWGMAVFGWVFMAAVIVLVVWLVWSSARSPQRLELSPRNAVDLLKERYATGEIERDEYLRRKADLER